MSDHVRHALLPALYAAAIDAAAPDRALDRALADEPMPGGPVRLFALGKAAHAMARAAAVRLPRGALAGGLVVAPDLAAPPHPTLTVVSGDHPIPGPSSNAAADALGDAVGVVRAGEEAWVLLSGGTSSLVGAPIPGVSADDYSALGRLLLASGLDIGAMNRVRKRVSRWGGGRLAVALAAQGVARVRVFLVSDVVGDSVETIASGPCAPDPSRASDVQSSLELLGLWSGLPPTVRAAIEAAASGRLAETPKPDDVAFRGVSHRVVAGNLDALKGAAAEARRRSYDTEVVLAPLTGEARTRGEEIARELLAHGATRFCIFWGGETTVTLAGTAAGRGGRCQELALAAARVLASAGAGQGSRIALLAAGTDGQDGPTDAAGATVDESTWGLIQAAGRDPARDLDAHRSYDALDAADALLRPGRTGTNVMDVVIGVLER